MRGRKATYFVRCFRCKTQQECPSECRSGEAVPFYTRSPQWAPPGPRARACGGGRISSTSHSRFSNLTRAELRLAAAANPGRMPHNYRRRKYSNRRVRYIRHESEVGRQGVAVDGVGGGGGDDADVRCNRRPAAVAVVESRAQRREASFFPRSAYLLWRRPSGGSGLS